MLQSSYFHKLFIVVLKGVKGLRYICNKFAVKLGVLNYCYKVRKDKWRECKIFGSIFLGFSLKCANCTFLMGKILSSANTNIPQYKIFVLKNLILFSAFFKINRTAMLNIFF